MLPTVAVLPPGSLVVFVSVTVTLIWIAGLPEETPFFITRFKDGWWQMGVFLIFGHFFLPFGALLSRSLKRSPRA